MDDLGSRWETERHTQAPEECLVIRVVKAKAPYTGIYGMANCRLSVDKHKFGTFRKSGHEVMRVRRGTHDVGGAGTETTTGKQRTYRGCILNRALR